LEPRRYRLTTIDRFIEPATTQDDGTFQIERTAEWIKNVGPLELFVSEDRTEDAYALIEPPFDLLRRVNPAYEGIPVVIKRPGPVNIGDVRVQFRYAKVVLNLLAAPPNIGIAETTWADVDLRLRDGNGRCVYEGSIPRLEVEKHLQAHQLNLALLQGRWSIELLFDGRVFAATHVFNTAGIQETFVNVLPTLLSRPCRWPTG
jgi:hypothetical protein